MQFVDVNKNRKSVDSHLLETLKHWMGAYQQSTVVTVQVLINNTKQNNDRRKDNTNPEQYKRKFTHGSAKKRGASDYAPNHKKYQ